MYSLAGMPWLTGEREWVVLTSGRPVEVLGLKVGKMLGAEGHGDAMEWKKWAARPGILESSVS